MIRVGLVSDTHIKGPGRQTDILLDLLRRQFKDVGLIIHAGDIVTAWFLAELEKIAPVEAVKGNMDSGDVHLPQTRLLELENTLIGIAHGSGPPAGIRERVYYKFKVKPDVVVFGHTHERFLGEEKGVIFVNPGSPNDTRFTDSNSVAIMTVNRNKIDVAFMDYDWSEIVRRANSGLFKLR